jgi:hypothetical protein
MFEPVMEISETFGPFALQNDCAAAPVGAEGMAFTVITGVPVLLLPKQVFASVMLIIEYVFVEEGLTNIAFPLV